MPSGKRVTLRDVARETGLSTATVSYALRGIRVPQATRDRVRAVADQLGYEADPIGRALASGRTGLVGVLCRSLDDMWQQDLAAALGAAFLHAEHPALIVDAGNDIEHEARLLNRLREQRVDALVVLPVDPAAPIWREVAAGTVLVSIGDALPGSGCTAEVLFDNAGAARTALRTLADAGHQRLAVLTTPETSTPDRPIDRIVREVSDEWGVSVALRSTSYGITAAAETVTALLADPDAPTGFVAISDTMAYGVYAAARRLGLAIPADLSVIGLDGNEVSQVLTPPLTGVSWPLDDVVATVVSHTLSGIDDTDGREAPFRAVFTPALVAGESVAGPPSRPD